MTSASPTPTTAERSTNRPFAHHQQGRLGAERLYDRLVSGESTFWEASRRPYLARELDRRTVRTLIARGLADGGGSYKELSRRFHMESEYKKLLNFLSYHKLHPDR